MYMQDFHHKNDNLYTASTDLGFIIALIYTNILI